MALDGRSSPKRRARSKQDITDEKIEVFFTALADTCNVVQSARSAGFSANWAYRKRKSDAGFRAGWARAVAEGYAKLELVLLDRAMNGTIKRVPSGSGEKRIREYPNQLAMALLKRHSDMAASIDDMLSEEEAEEIRERILLKLMKKREREGEGENEASGA
ncbi:MAG: hypothetical protein HOP96_07075 [Sphingomonas sp.]|nr:hypothetical protein [Sphingomonas sp.]